MLARSVRGARRHLRAHLPDRRAVRARDRLLLPPNLGSAGLERYRNGRSTGEATSNLQSDPRPAPGQAPDGRRGRHDARPARAAGRQRGARRPRRRGRGARTAHRRGHGDGLLAELRPQRAALAARLRTLTANARARRCVNRATQFGYAPGSTFKVVTATAAIDTGRVHARIDGQRRNDVARLRRAAAERQRRELRADHAHAGAGATRSTPSGRRSPKVGKPTLARYMSRFGFDRKPQLDYPRRSRCRAAASTSATAADPADQPAASTSGAWASARTSSRSRRCRWPRSPRPSPTTGG